MYERRGGGGSGVAEQRGIGLNRDVYWWRDENARKAVLSGCNEDSNVHDAVRDGGRGGRDIIYQVKYIKSSNAAFIL